MEEYTRKAKEQWILYGGLYENYEVEQEMYRRAVELIETRYPVVWGGVRNLNVGKDNYRIAEVTGGNDFDKKYSYC